MKRLLTVIIALLATQFNVNAQYWSENSTTNSLYPTTLTRKVGIGLNNPSTTLHLQNGNSATYLTLANGAAAENYIGEVSGILFNKHYGNNQSAKIYAYTNWANNSYQGSDLRFATNQAANNLPVDRMVIKSDGKVGIGLNTPSAMLHIHDGLGGEQLRISRGTGTVRFVQENNRDNLYLYNNNATKIYMIWQDNGNVGIGTAPGATTKLAVDGLIGAREIRVLTGPWPDYVFANTYKLRPLTEVEQYINENKHLPDVPAASEVEKEGVLLGEMNATLLRKIEELTLYMIEQNKQLQELKKENEEFKNKVANLENNR